MEAALDVGGGEAGPLVVRRRELEGVRGIESEGRGITVVGAVICVCVM